MTAPFNSSFRTSSWKMLLATSTLTLSVCGSDPVEFDILQVGPPGSSTPWVVAIEDIAADSISEDGYTLYYLRQKDPTQQAEPNRFVFVTPELSISALSGDRLRLLAPESNTTYHIQVPVPSEGNSSSLFSLHLAASQSDGLVPAQLVVAAPGGEAYSVGIGVDLDPGTSMTIDTRPIIQDSPSTVSFLQPLDGSGFLRLKGGGSVHLLQGGSSFSGNIYLDSPPEMPDLLSVSASLSVNELDGDGLVVLNIAEGSLTFHVSDPMAVSKMGNTYTQGEYVIAPQRIVKSGPGTLEVFSGDSQFLGGMDIQAGILKLAQSSTFHQGGENELSYFTGPLGTASIRIATNATLDLGGHNLDNSIGAHHPAAEGYCTGVITNSVPTVGTISAHAHLYLASGHELRSEINAAPLHILGSIHSPDLISGPSAVPTPPVRVTTGTVLLSGQSPFIGLLVEGGTLQVGAVPSSITTPAPSAFTQGPLGYGNSNDDPLQYAICTDVRSSGTLDANGFDIYNPILLSGTLKNSHASTGATIYSKVGLNSSSPIIDGGPSLQPLTFKNLIRAPNTDTNLQIIGGVVSFESNEAHVYGTTLIGNSQMTPTTLKIQHASNLPGDAYVFNGGSLDLADGISSIGGSVSDLRDLTLEDSSSLVFRITNPSHAPNISTTWYGSLIGHSQEFTDFPTINVVDDFGIAIITEGLKDSTEYGALAGSFSKAGPGALILQGPSTASGCLQILDGVIEMAAGSSLSPSMTLKMEGGFFNITKMTGENGADLTVDLGLLSGTNGGVIQIGANSLRSTLAGENASCNATLEGLGTFYVAGSSGSLTFGADLSNYRGSIKVAPLVSLHLLDNCTVKNLGSGVYANDVESLSSGPIAIAANKVLTIQNNAGPAYITNPISGSGSIALSMDEYSATFSDGAKTYTGGTHVLSGFLKAQGSVVRVEETGDLVSGPLGLGSVTVDNGAYLDVECVELPNSLHLDGSLRLRRDLQQESQISFSGEQIIFGSASATIDTLTYNHAILAGQVIAPLGFRKNGSGTASFTNSSNQIQGSVSLQEGILNFESCAPMGSITMAADTRVNFRDASADPIAIYDISSSANNIYINFDNGHWNMLGAMNLTGTGYTVLISGYTGPTSVTVYDPAHLPSKISAFGGSGRLILDFDTTPHVSLNTTLDGGWGAEVHKYGKSTLTVPGSKLYSFLGPFCAYEGTTLITEPGSFAQTYRTDSFGNSSLAARGGVIAIPASAHSPEMNVYGLELSNGGSFDFSFSRSSLIPSVMAFSIYETLAGRGSINLRPESPSVLDSPMLKLRNSWVGTDPGFAINVLPKNILGDESSQTVNVLGVSSQMQSTMGVSYQAFKDWLASIVSAGAFFHIESSNFHPMTLTERGQDSNIQVSYDVLSCQVRAKSLAEVFEAPDLSALPWEYQSLGKSILALGASSTSFAETDIYQNLITSATSLELGNRIIGLFSSELHSIALSFLSNKRSRTANNTYFEDSASRDIKKLMLNQGWAPSLVRSISHQSTKSQSLLSKTLGAMHNPDEAIRSIDYSDLDIAGLSFSSGTSYSYETQPKQSEDKPGFTQSSWSASLSGSYNFSQSSALGVTLLTTKSHQNLNPNQYQKTDARADRYNGATLQGILQGASQPWALTSSLTYGQHNYSQVRTWIQSSQGSPDFTSQASSSYAANETSGSLEARWKWDLDSATLLQPFISYNITHTANQAYSETSINIETGLDNLYGMIVPEQSATSHQQSLGLEVLHATQLGDLAYQVRTRLGLSTEKLAGEYTTFNYAYAMSPDQDVTVEVPTQRYNSLDLTFGIHGCLKENLFFSALYSGQFGQYQTTNTALVSVEYSLG